jgi:hypothetical protein
VARPQVELVEPRVLGVTLRPIFPWIVEERDPERVGDGAGKLLLNRENVGFIPTVRRRPEVRAVARTKELSGHSQVVLRFPDAPLDDRVDSQVLSDLWDTDTLALELKGTSPRRNDAARRLHPDVPDISMPLLSGLEAAACARIATR